MESPRLQEHQPSSNQIELLEYVSFIGKRLFRETTYGEIFTTEFRVFISTQCCI
ncbi:hypothetical protein Spb1_13320 [Planctopirus ephydatiae]|uniref:Uncharacterized protein n=1 Tax=Planctopirus ephydatiae TaxID=2528019 RepID=A0A518GLH4_9PLAN|nr:hypothetical protein Spb1_13320 [Planctopirus ephydatiae]